MKTAFSTCSPNSPHSSAAAFANLGSRSIPFAHSIRPFTRHGLPNCRCYGSTWTTNRVMHSARCGWASANRRSNAKNLTENGTPSNDLPSAAMACSTVRVTHPIPVARSVRSSGSKRRLCLDSSAVPYSYSAICQASGSTRTFTVEGSTGPGKSMSTTIGMAKRAAVHPGFTFQSP